METRGSGLSQREEDIAHDGGATNTRGGDNIEDTVHILTKVFLKRGGRADMSDNILSTHKHTHARTHTHTHTHKQHTYPVRIQVLRLFELDWVDFTGFVFCADL